MRDDLVTGVQTCALPIYSQGLEVAPADWPVLHAGNLIEAGRRGPVGKTDLPAPSLTLKGQIGNHSRGSCARQRFKPREQLLKKCGKTRRRAVAGGVNAHAARLRHVPAKGEQIGGVKTRGRHKEGPGTF